MEDLTPQLDNLVLAYVRGRRLRIATRNEPVLRVIFSTFIVKTLIRNKYGKFVNETTEMYDVQQRASFREVLTVSGLLPELVKLCGSLRVPIRIVDMHLEAEVKHALLLPPLEYVDVEAEWGNLRDWQQDTLRLMRHSRMGRIRAATGAGKSRYIAKFCKIARTSRILVTTNSVQDIMNLHRGILGESVPSDVLTGSKRKLTGARVICCSTSSLGAVSEMEFDVAIGDEVHEHASATARANLWKINSHRIFGLSANQDERRDRSDRWIEGFYGPLLLERTYQDNQAAGDVVPIKIRTITTRIAEPCKVRAMSAREACLVVRNGLRNEDIARVARHYCEAGKQVLILVRTTEHCLRVRYALPEAVAVFGKATAERWKTFSEAGLTRAGEPMGLTQDQVAAIQEKFKTQEYRLVVANSIWFKGKDFPALDVLIRGDALSSVVANTQLTGRLSRVYAGKEYGLMVDCEDGFDSALHRRFKDRCSIYRKNGWEIVRE